MKLFRFKKSKKNSPLLSSQFLRQISTHQELTALHDHFKEILKTLRQHHLEKLPWHILIGPEESGKTTLLDDSIHHWLSVIPSVLQTQTFKASHAMHAVQHPICARINQDAVFIEIPGRYLQEANHAQGVFSTFLKLIKKHKIQSLISGITVVINFDDLSKLPIQKHQEQIYLIKHRLQDFIRILKRPINLQIFFSKIDTLLGFNEFFAESLQEERLDIFGIELTGNTLQGIQPAGHIFNEQFESLVQKLNERIIWSLHRERYIARKALIADFPQQFSAFKGLLHKYVYDLVDLAPYQNKILLKNICFFSNLHSGKTTDYLAKLLSTYHFSERNTNTKEPPKPKSYFVGRLLKKTSQLPLLSKTTHSEATWEIPRYLKLTFTFLLTFSAILYLGINFRQKTLLIHQIQKEFIIINHNVTFSEDSLQLLQNEAQTLSYLQNIHDLLKEMPLAFLISIKWHPLHHLQQQTDQNYQKILQNQFIPALENALAKNLINASASDPKSIYPNLKAYLSLKNPQKNSAYLNQWLKNYFGEQKTSELNIPLNIQELNLKTWPHSVPLDNTAIHHAQMVLKNLPKPLLAYLILKGENIETINPFPTDFDKIFVAPKANHAISHIYTQAALADIYFDQIPTAVHSTFSGNAVLGKTFFTEANSNDLASIINQVQTLYLMDYTNQWQRIFVHSEIKLANNLSQAIEILTILTKKPSPLTVLIKNVVKETTLNLPALTKNRSLGEQQRFNDHIKNYFTIDNSMYRFLQAKPDFIEKTIPPEFVKIKQNLESIANATDSTQSAFQVAKNEYKNQAVFGKLAKNAFESPQPLSRWLISLISNDWLILLQNSHIYLNRIWQNTVFAEYQLKISNRYPLVKQSLVDIELADFAHFFAKEGSLDAFFNQNLLPFVDTSQPRWQWRELYGQVLSDDPALPLQLERAALIRKMFFSKTGELSVEFYLTPVEMGPNVREVQINIDGRTVSNQKQELNIIPFNWPGIKNREGSSLTFLRHTGEQTFLTEKGPWSFFRLLDAAYIQPLNNSKYFAVLFDLNGNAARYQLIADNVINPFIPNFIADFNCKERI